MWPKIKKFTVVVAITLLIWVWADLAQDEPLDDRAATIVVDESANPNLWVHFNRYSSVDIKVDLSGPHGAISEIKKQLKEKPYQFEFDASQFEMDEPGEHYLEILPFLQKDRGLKELGIKVTSCEPTAPLEFKVEELVKKTLNIQCKNEDDDILTPESVSPSKIEMYVPNSWDGDMLIAEVRMNPTEIAQARVSAIPVTPYVEFGGKVRQAGSKVEVKLAKAEADLQPFDITSANIVIAFGTNLVGKYDVELLNFGATVRIKATPAAKEAYKSQPYHMILYIDEDDVKQAGEQSKPVIYNLPEEFVREDKINISHDPVKVKFKVIDLAKPDVEAGN